MHRIPLVFIFILTFQLVNAQVERPKLVNLFEISLSASEGQFAAAESWSQLHRIGKKGRMQIGYGVRFTSYTASNKSYTTAPAKYTSPRQDIFTIFSTTFDEN